MQDFGKDDSFLNNSKQKHKKFPNFHQNSLENEIIFAKRGYVYFNVGFFGFCYKFLATLNQVSLINLIKILCFSPIRYLYSAYKIFLM